MRIVIQRVKRASVSVEEKVVGSIQKGFLVLIGVGQGDDEATADKYMKKLLGLRIFEDENGKTNKSLADVDGQLLMVSQFTLYANCKKGNRPSFTEGYSDRETCDRGAAASDRRQCRRRRLGCRQQGEGGQGRLRLQRPRRQV